MFEFLKRWSYHWSDHRVFYQSIATSAFVGTVLLLITLGGRLFSGTISPVVLGKGFLTYLVPYLVSSFTAVRTQFRLAPDQYAPQKGIYGCESCLYDGEGTHDEELEVNDQFPECPRHGRATEYVLKEVRN